MISSRLSLPHSSDLRGCDWPFEAALTFLPVASASCVSANVLERRRLRCRFDAFELKTFSQSCLAAISSVENIIRNRYDLRRRLISLDIESGSLPLHRGLRLLNLPDDLQRSATESVLFPHY